jgi:hypothetical protein
MIGIDLAVRGRPYGHEDEQLDVPSSEYGAERGLCDETRTFGASAGRMNTRMDTRMNERTN